MKEPIAAILHKKSLMVVCNDGSTYRLVKNKWQTLPPVPGTNAEQEDISSRKKAKGKIKHVVTSEASA
ncbi:MAG: hypothetical protein ABI679_14005 [Gemmatimonadota bacterium]